MDKRNRVLKSLAGLSVGDAFGESFYHEEIEKIGHNDLPQGPWFFTDDTQMALSVVDVLLDYGGIDQDALVRSFTRRFEEQPMRCYGSGTSRLLQNYADGKDWRKEAAKLYEGGSFGSGASMRSAPIGAFFCGDPDRAASEAHKAAEVTHTHPEGLAGAMAVSAAAAIAAQVESGNGILSRILAYVPDSETRKRIELAADIAADELETAISILGTGQKVSAFDTVPFCLWVVAHHSDTFEESMWTAVSGLGDRDTICAIVGSISGIYREIPNEWMMRREALPNGFDCDRIYA